MLIFRQAVKQIKYNLYLWISATGNFVFPNLLAFIIGLDFNGFVFLNLIFISIVIWDLTNVRTRIPIEIIFDDEEKELRLCFRKGYLVKDNLAVKYKDLTYCYRFKLYKRRVPKTLDFFDEGKLFLALPENNNDGWSNQQIKQIMEKLSTICNEVPHKQSVPIKQRV
jgi:hypothetical protein